MSTPSSDAGSAARGFEIRDLRTGFEGQYLLLEVRRGSAGPAPPDDRVEIDRLIAGFDRQRAEWGKLLEEPRHRGRRVALWGGGSRA